MSLLYLVLVQPPLPKLLMNVALLATLLDKNFLATGKLCNCSYISSKCGYMNEGFTTIHDWICEKVCRGRTVGFSERGVINIHQWVSEVRGLRAQQPPEAIGCFVFKLYLPKNLEHMLWNCLYALVKLDTVKFLEGVS